VFSKAKVQKLKVPKTTSNLSISSLFLPKQALFSLSPVLTVNFGSPNVFVTLWFELDYVTNPPLCTLMI
jgi:hypothetical protein